jgi:glycosyltransferase involved in cell wall biosynthesis
MVILEYHPVVGGAQRQLASIAPLLVDRGVEVHVITRAVEGRPRRETIDGVSVHRLAAPGPKAIASLIFTALAWLRIRALKPDVVHGYNLFSPATIAMLARATLDVPVVLKVLRGGVGGDVSRLRRKLFGSARIRGLRQGVDRFHTVSTEIDVELQCLGIPPDRRCAISNGVDTQHFRCARPGEKEALRREQGLPVDEPVVVFCGRLVPEKRVDLLIDAWRCVHQRIPDAHLSIIGTGPEADGLRCRAGEGVRFEGALADVAPRLRTADVFVLPSEAEGQSNALLEATASALPVVATRVGGAIDVVQHGHSGLLVAPNDVEALAEALIEILEDPEREKLGERGREIMVGVYSLDSVADRLYDLYVEVDEAFRSGGALVGRDALWQVEAPPLPFRLRLSE